MGFSLDSLLICKFFLFWRMAKEPFLCLGSRGLPSTGSDGEQLGAVVGLTMFEDAKDGVQELPHDGDEGLEFGFAFAEQMLIEGTQRGIVLHGNQSGHKEGGAQMAIAGLADAGFSPHGGAGGVLARIEAGGGDPLPDIEIRREQAEF